MILPRFTAQRAFFALAGGQLVSTLGSGMTRFGLGLWVLSDEVGGSAADYTTMLFAAILPLGVASLFVGPLIDRWNRRWTMILANAGASAPTIIVALLYFSGALEIWHLYIALVANGVASAFILPALDASTPMLMPQDQLGRAAGVTQMLQSFEIILAPVLARCSSRCWMSVERWKAASARSSGWAKGRGWASCTSWPGRPWPRLP